MAHQVRVLHNPTQATLRMHYANCNTYNADFDGDEMNCHFPQNDLARSESENIASNDLQYNAPTDGAPLRGLIQDHVDGGVKLCGKNSFLEREEYMQLVFSSITTLPGLEVLSYEESIEFLPPAILKPRQLWTGKQVVSTLLQQLRRTTYKDQRREKTLLPGISMERKAKTPATAFGEDQKEHLIVIRDGELLRGVLDKAAFGATEFSLVHAVHEAYGPHKAGLLLNCFGRLFTHYIQAYSGHSCRMEDLVLTATANKRRRKLADASYNIGMNAAKAWAESEGGKSEIDDKNLSDKPLAPHERADTARKIHTLLSGKEGQVNAEQLDAYMQSKLNPLASDIIKTCLPSGLMVPFPLNTFSLMVLTGAKGSMVNQSQVSCGLGQQALEGRRVPRMSSGRTLPSFDAYDPNPRADGFITDRFLTGIRPQEYYFHCMAGREGLVDTAVKTSRSGYLQRCLVKHLEELTVHYDYTVRDAEGNVVQFLYGEDSIDPTKAAHLDCSSTTLQYMVRNADTLKQQYKGGDDCSIKSAYDEATAALAAATGEGGKGSFTKGERVLAKRLRDEGQKFKLKNCCSGFSEAIVKKVRPDGKLEISYTSDKAKVAIPVSRGGEMFVKKHVRDPLLGRGDKKMRLGTSGACVSEKVALKVQKAIDTDKELKTLLDEKNMSPSDLSSIVAAKYASALVAPGEAVGSIAAQSVGEPSTQMTLNTFHLAGHGGANVTLGIPRLREIIMSASRSLKTPTMALPFREGVTKDQQMKLSRKFLKLSLAELLDSDKGITVTTAMSQGDGGQWERTYQVTLKMHPEERIRKAFDIGLEEIADAVSKKFMQRLGYLMKQQLQKAKQHDGETGDIIVNVPKGAGFEMVEGAGRKKKGGEEAGDGMGEDDDDADDGVDGGGEEDGVMGARAFGGKEMAGYGEETEEDKGGKEDARQELFGNDDDDSSAAEEEKKEAEGGGREQEGADAAVLSNAEGTKLDKKNNEIVLPMIRVDVSTRPLLLTDLCEAAAAYVVVRQVKDITKANVIDGEKDGEKVLQIEGSNFEEIWNLDPAVVDHSKISSNDIWAIRCAFGVEAAAASIGGQITSVFGVYGIEVDPRHLSLISDYMTFGGEYKPMNRRGMQEGSSAFCQMSFETTSSFMTEAAMKNQKETLQSPSANIVLGNPVKAGTGAFQCIVPAS
ncbi:hypothetical protein TeGR_g3546 [Tetraparma gracilis]|nr:hypothetical protein TeGR_g3546 [Tetraparma gracilis]